jgi:glucose-6-phosphate dehydrogenase assembly protein OpcA
MVATEPGTGHWEARNTTVQEVECHLGRLLRELAPPAGGDLDSPHPPPRASVLNLIVHADEEGEAERAAAIMAKLASRHPSRTLLLVPAPDDPADALDATVRTQCGDRSGRRGHSCYEQVQLVARGSMALHLASVVEPLLMSNLPTFVWWLGRPPNPHDRLLELCDRLVVDSDDFPDAAAGLAVLDACAADSATRLDVGDLGWRRIGPWCQLIAQFFDPRDARPYQRRFRRVAIEYAATPAKAVSAAPLLMAGWLATRLGWEPETTSAARGSLDLLFAADRHAAVGESDEVTIQIRPRQDASAPAGALLAVTLQAGPREAEALFEISGGADRACVATRAVLPGVREMERIAPLGHTDTAELLGHELERPAADAIYAETVAMVGRLVQ